jgi:putative membrane protein
VIGDAMPKASLKGWCLLTGLTVTVTAWFGPLPAAAAQHFSASAVLHVALVCIAAPLIAAGLAGSRFDMVRRWPQGFSPLAASMLQGAVVWGWQAPAAQAAARASAVFLWAEQGSFLIVAALLWLTVLGGERETRYERVGAGIVALLLTSVHMTLLAGLSMIAHRPLLGAELGATFDDRRLGALVTLAGAGVVYAVAGAMLVAWLLRPEPNVRAGERVLPR